MKTRFFPWIILLALLSRASMAQDNGDPENNLPKPTATETPARTESPQQQPSQANPAPEKNDFTPTEEISEDISVPFPVDI